MIKTVDAATYVRAKTIRDLANKIDGISGYVYTGEWIDGQVATTGEQPLSESSFVMFASITSHQRGSGANNPKDNYRNESYYVSLDHSFTFDYPVDPRTIQAKVTVTGTYYSSDKSYALHPYRNVWLGDKNSWNPTASNWAPEEPAQPYDWSGADESPITYDGTNYDQPMKALAGYRGIVSSSPLSYGTVVGEVTGYVGLSDRNMKVEVSKDMLSARVTGKIIVDQRRYSREDMLIAKLIPWTYYDAKRWLGKTYTLSLGGLGFQDSREEYSRGSTTHVFKEPDSAFLRKDSKANGTLLTDMKLQELLDEGFGDGALVVEFDYKVLDQFLNIGDIVFVKDRTGRYIGGTLADGSPRIMFRIVKVEDISKATFSQTVTAIQTAHI